MALKIAHILSTSGLQTASFLPRPKPPERFIKAESGACDTDLDRGEPGDGLAQRARRMRIWQFGTNLHCSIIGTCLSTAELRHVLDKLDVGGAADVSDHDLHCIGVTLAGRREDGAKFIQKALDRRHRSAIARYSKARDAASLLALWEESFKQGDIPGAYWAALTHPATTEDVVKRVFADVHMLSHLVGAANRADIRRLRQLEQDNAALASKIERQQRQLHEGFAARDRTIRHLNDLLARQAGEPLQQPPRCDLHRDVDTLVCELNRRLARETAGRERSERRAHELSASLKETERTLQISQKENQAYRQELDLVERQLAGLLRPDAHVPATSIDLSGLTLLYVGGRAPQIPPLRDMIERTGAHFLHHDGGIEHSSVLIPGLVSRADRVFFPIDCISHDAMVTIKRLCRVTDKPYEPLRTASLTCLLSALSKMSGNRERVAAE